MEARYKNSLLCNISPNGPVVFLQVEDLECSLSSGLGELTQVNTFGTPGKRPYRGRDVRLKLVNL